MRFFRSTWLQRILLVLFLIFLNAGSFFFVEQQREIKDEITIHVERFQEELHSLCQRYQIKCGFDVIPVSIVTIFKKNISDDFISGTSCDPFRINLLTFSSRGPPRFITAL